MTSWCYMETSVCRQHYSMNNHLNSLWNYFALPSLTEFTSDINRNLLWIYFAINVLHTIDMCHYCKTLPTYMWLNHQYFIPSCLFMVKSYIFKALCFYFVGFHIPPHFDFGDSKNTPNCWYNTKYSVWINLWTEH